MTFKRRKRVLEVLDKVHDLGVGDGAAGGELWAVILRPAQQQQEVNFLSWFLWPERSQGAVPVASGCGRNRTSCQSGHLKKVCQLEWMGDWTMAFILVTIRFSCWYFYFKLCSLKVKTIWNFVKQMLKNKILITKSKSIFDMQADQHSHNFERLRELYCKILRSGWCHSS